MPNHCYQSVYLRGPLALMQELHNHLSNEDPSFCSVVLPMPIVTWIIPPHGEGSYTTPAWYEWRCSNWGTKWDVCEVASLSDIEVADGDDDGLFAKAWFSFECWTAWAPPIPVWEKLHSLRVDVEADYEDEGGEFKGQWINGEDNCWKPDNDEELS